MASQQITLYTCDRCKAKEPARSGGGYEPDSLPLNWSTVRHALGNSAHLSTLHELCGSCTSEWKALHDGFMRRQSP